MKKYATYVFIGLLIFLSVNYISTNFEADVRDSAGLIVSAISILCAVIVVCTLILADAIKDNHKDN
ncbi:hypothetical protein JHL18_00045 [Clostridium sp. YIM B02505]|uniref:Uncharacterized protein n=1 Tax=Clostridium yunnanense TaxID=2800325 RepID=A0ABS1EI75_9CLOT|nr:hypothetical protein [Clostridium yunnanense]MBK1809041.1 hypothetical protein [Clostridium yunnanense]